VGRSPATFIFKKTAFTEDEIDRIEAVAERNRLELLYTPRTRPQNVFTRMMTAEDPAVVWNSFETNAEPPRDNNPFFFNSLRLSDLGRALTGAEEWRKTNMGTFMLFASLALTSILVVLFLIIPLAAQSGRELLGSRRGFSHLLYFACLGGGFIIVEIALIQRFILFLGHPVYSLAVVLFSLLTFSAAGSYLTGRFSEAGLMRSLTRVLAVLSALGLLYVLVLPQILYGLVHLNHGVRIAIAVALLSPLALLMGMPMPLGIKLLNRRAPRLIPWAWGINGATSVTGSVAALVVAVMSGFDQALLVGVALYICGLLWIVRAERGSSAVPDPAGILR
jgi:hypothetical protein